MLPIHSQVAVCLQHWKSRRLNWWDMARISDSSWPSNSVPVFNNFPWRKPGMETNRCQGMLACCVTEEYCSFYLNFSSNMVWKLSVSPEAVLLCEKWCGVEVGGRCKLGGQREWTEAQMTLQARVWVCLCLCIFHHISLYCTDSCLRFSRLHGSNTHRSFVNKAFISVNK